MILDEFVRTFAKGKYKQYYTDLGYNTSEKYIYVNIKHLKDNSVVRINVKCDICGEEKKIKYQDYQKITNKQTENYYCKGCKFLKFKKTCLRIYGVENPSQLETIKERKVETCLKNYGVENPSQSEIIKDRKIQTCNDNFGVDYPGQNPEIFHKQHKSGYLVQKFRDTNITYQGSYELDFLDKYYGKVKIENGPTINYSLNDELHYYHSDFYLPDYDLVVEIKSSYWYEKHEECVIAKEKETKTHYNYLLILDKNYENLNKLFNI